MGNGIAQAAAASGLQVIMMDVHSEAVKKGLATIESSCDRLIKKEKLNLLQTTKLKYYNPYQVEVSKFGTPASAMVGRFGNSGERLALVMAMARRRLLCR